MENNPLPRIGWTEGEVAHSADWRSSAGLPPPRRVVVADDTLSADAAYRLACEGTALLWRGDFQNARQLLQALTRRVERKPRKPVGSPQEALLAPRARKPGSLPPTPGGGKPRMPPWGGPAEAFHQHRLAQSQRARILGMLLLPFEADHRIPLRRAPDVQSACREVYGVAAAPYVASLRELLGLIGAHEWRKKGVPVAALGQSIHPHHGVFAPIRSEYVGLVASAPLPKPLPGRAFDIGTGTGVLAAVLAQRGIKHIVATEQDPRALACARENIDRLGFAGKIKLVEADLFPPGRAALVVCNPPWLPARPSSPLERAVYDPDSQMLRGFLSGLAAHLEPGGEGWLILSDLAEHLGLRARDELQKLFDAAGLRVVGKIDARPTHPKASDPTDPLHAARAAEVTSLWRLVTAG